MSDPITAQAFMAGLSCNGGTRDVPAPSKPPPPEVLVPHLWDRALLVTEIADLRAQLADADKTLAGFVKAVREARECIVAIRDMADSIDAMPSTAAFAIRETCDRWLSPPLASITAQLRESA